MKLTRRQLIGLIKEELSEARLPAWERPPPTLRERVKDLEEHVDALQAEISELRRAIQKQGTN